MPEPGADTAEFVRWGKIASLAPEATRFLGHALYRDGQYEEAIRCLQAEKAPV